MDELIELMRRLRDPEQGCPWDRAQTFESIAPYTIEEAYEVADAITRQDMADLVDELGDLLFQVVFHARMAEEIGAFDFHDVVGAIVAKMIRRHPHVYPVDGDPTLGQSHDEGRDAAASAGTEGGSSSLQRVQGTWEAIKAAERAAKSDGRPLTSVLDEVTAGLPALKRAAKLQSRAKRIGFDWPSWHGVFEKLREEVEELERAIHDDPASAHGPSASPESESPSELRPGVELGVELGVESGPELGLESGPESAERAEAMRARISDELGDVMFTCVNLARHFSLDADRALREANARFERRFRHMEASAGGALLACTLDELEARWQAAKRHTDPAP